MNATLWREKFKTMPFSLSNLCQSQTLPRTKQAPLRAFRVWTARAQPGSPTRSHPFFDSFCQGWGTCPWALFFPWAPTFASNCQCAPVQQLFTHTAPWNILQGSNQTHTVTLAAVRTPLAGTWEAERDGEGAWVVSGNKGRGIVGYTTQKKKKKTFSAF